MSADVPPSPTARRNLVQLALHQLGRHMAYPTIHPATRASLHAAGYTTTADDLGIRLTPKGWAAVGVIADQEPT